MPLDYGEGGDFELNRRKDSKLDKTIFDKDFNRQDSDNSSFFGKNGGNGNFDTESNTAGYEPLGGKGGKGGAKNLCSNDKNGYNSRDLDSINKKRLVLDALAPIYFDFDKYNIRKDMQEYIRANADFIKRNNITEIVLQGNTDEFGTDEYNIALGQKRALSVRDALVVYGLPKSMFSTISYGAHNPVCYEKNSECYAKNRRTEIIEKR